MVSHWQKQAKKLAKAGQAPGPKVSKAPSTTGNGRFFSQGEKSMQRILASQPLASRRATRGSDSDSEGDSDDFEVRRPRPQPEELPQPEEPVAQAASGSGPLGRAPNSDPGICATTTASQGEFRVLPLVLVVSLRL